MRLLCAILCLMVVSACGSGRVPAIIAPEGASNPQIVAQRQSQIGAPLMQVGIENLGVAGVVVETVVRDGTRTWLSADGGSFTTRDGFLVATRALGEDMMSSDVAESAALVLGRRAGRAQRFHSFITGEDDVVIRSYICDVAVSGERGLNLPDGAVVTTLMSEDCASSDQQFKNLYWVSLGSGRVVQSRQWAGPRSGPLALRPLQE